MPGNGADAVARAKVLVDTSLTDERIDVLIDSAEALMTAHVDPHATDLLTSDLRRTIVDWLAAHFCAVVDRLDKATGVGGIRITKDGNTGMGLDFTPQGQMAKALDPTGRLAIAGRKVRYKLVYVASGQYAECKVDVGDAC